MSIKSALGLKRQKKLHFQLASPFKGLMLLDQEGNMITEQRLTLNDLHGIRILTMPGTTTTITLYNKLNTDVKITKNINTSLQPLITYRDDIVKLFYLSDAMDYKNSVCIELKSNRIKEEYEISGFSHTSIIEDEKLEINQIKLYKSNDNLELFAVPLTGNDLTPISLFKEDEIYTIPNNHDCKQWIVISNKDKGRQLMPRFVNIDENYEPQNRDEHINNYANQLEEEDYNSKIWQDLLKLFSICSHNNYDIPFSTFDQFRALTLSSKIAAKAFLFMAVNQYDLDAFLQKDIPEMEKDLGVCFHWVSQEDWRNAFDIVIKYYNIPADEISKYIEILNNYFNENSLSELSRYISGNKLDKTIVTHSIITGMRSRLGERVLAEIPSKIPEVNSYYSIPIDSHSNVAIISPKNQTTS